MNVADLRNELKARNINSKGLKSQLIAKLMKALKSEIEASEDNSEAADKQQEDDLNESDAVEVGSQEELKSEVRIFFFMNFV